MKKPMQRLVAVLLALLTMIPLFTAGVSAVVKPVPAEPKVVMTAAQFIAKLKDAAAHKTLYVMGCFGAPMTASSKTRYKNNCAYNQNPTRQAMIDAASSDTFGFDCVCLIKGILWGWNGNLNHVYGGASYASNGVPDVGADGMMGSYCTGVSTNFSGIVAGEAVWMSGHIGVYIGGGQVIECSPKWSNNVQYSNLGNIGYTSGHSRNWTKHGKLPWISYSGGTPPAPPSLNTAYAGYYKCIADPSLRIRSGDSTACAQLGSIPLNATVYVDGRTPNGWAKLTYGGVTGYSAMDGYLERITHTVTFKDWNGTVLKTQTVYHKANATPPTASRTGYSFAGWSGSYTNVTGNCTVTATYTVNTYTNTISHWLWGFENKDSETVTDANNGGTAVKLATTTFQATYDTNITLDSSKCITPPNGCQIGQKTVQTNLYESRDTYCSVYGNQNFPYTHHYLSCGFSIEYEYEPVTYTISYTGLEGASHSNPTTYNVLYGVTLSAPTERASYTFVGWYSGDVKVTGINEGKGARFTTVQELTTELAKRQTGNITLEARWLLNIPADITSSAAGSAAGVKKLSGQNMFRGIPQKTAVKDVLTLFEQDSKFLDIRKKNGTALTNSTEWVGTGCTVNIVDNGEVKRSYVLVVIGDVNGDAKVDTIDYVAEKKALKGRLMLDGGGNAAADCNCDGAVTALDCIMLAVSISS